VPDFPRISTAENYKYIDKPAYATVKRGLDICLSIIGLNFISPIMLATAIAIKCEDGESVIHKRTGIGKDKKELAMCKFRSMVKAADSLTDIGFTSEQCAA
jgi:lipopolysaccharide/colanic/teichoic acid biosynthesis glycosyltransferase